MHHRIEYIKGLFAHKLWVCVDSIAAFPSSFFQRDFAELRRELNDPFFPVGSKRGPYCPPKCLHDSTCPTWGRMCTYKPRVHLLPLEGLTVGTHKSTANSGEWR